MCAALPAEREIAVELVVTMDNGEVESFNAYRVQARSRVCTAFMQGARVVARNGWWCWLGEVGARCIASDVALNRAASSTPPWRLLL